MVISKSLTRAGGALVFVSVLTLPHPAAASDRAAEQARVHVEGVQHELGLTAADIGGMTVSDVVESKHSGVTHVYFEQRHRGIAVHGGILNVNVAADGAILGSSSRFVSNLASLAEGQDSHVSALDAAGAAAAYLELEPTTSFSVLQSGESADQAMTLSAGGIAAQPIEAKLVWLRVDRTVRLAWRLDIEETDGQHYWCTFIDAENGASLAKEDLVIHDSVDAIAHVIARPASADIRTTASAFPSTDGAQYNVFPVPVESPNHGSRELVTNAADPSASPFGWHDTDGMDGPEFTVTRGNNVHAYTDLNADNVPDPGSDPDGGPTLNFDSPLDLSQDPSTYRPAAVTNLFYWNNVMHDVAHGYGFDEASGNFQVNNYGNGGTGGDDVRAEAQDGSGTNNANFGTPADGLRPRMQMFVWTPGFPNRVRIPMGPIAGDYRATRAVFGPQLSATGPISEDVSLVNDGAGASPNDGCEPFVGFPTGTIALLDRGACRFDLKVQNAQTAGAVGVIVANNRPGNPITMGGAVAVTIPSVMVSQADGTLFKANLPFAATMEVNPTLSTNRDSDLDAGVIAHEYGHGISNRLTGGPAIVSCLQGFSGNSEQMGEGWSDWFALTLTTRPGDTPTMPRGVGTYLIFQPTDGRGIRPTPYSTDVAVNPSTYASVADVANISQPHGIGYVWNTMLWEVYWNLVDRYGYNEDVYGDWTTGGNNLALQLVMDGMKFQPCQPGLVDGRDAILQADVALTGGANECEIWRGFTKRGLGFSADQGSSIVRTDGVEAFDFPASCTAAEFGGFQRRVTNPPAVNRVKAGRTVRLNFSLSGVGQEENGDSDDDELLGLLIDSQPVDCDTLVPIGEAPTPITLRADVGFEREGDQFRINWRTSRSWRGTCRKLTIRIPAPEDAVAFFRFGR